MTSRFEQGVGIGAVLVVLAVVAHGVQGGLDEPRPCIQVPTIAHQDANGYWWAGTIGPYGWSYPGESDCIVEVEK